ncbi:unnamed protein product, partial [Brachionus calyciflorus]
EFYYADFCDFYLESTKPVFKSSDIELEQIVWNILRQCNNYTLLMYHPFIPSITEELWQKNNSVGSFDSILDFKYPSSSDIVNLTEVNIEEVDEVIKTTKSIISMALKIKKAVNTNERPSILVKISNDLISKEIKNLSNEIVHLGKLKFIEFETKEQNSNFKHSINLKLSDKCDITIRFENEINVGLAITRFEKNLEKKRIQLKSIKNKLNESEKKEDQTSVDKLRFELNEIISEISNLEEQLKMLQSMRK